MKIIDGGVAYDTVLAHLHGEGFDEPWSRDSFHSALSSPGTFALIAVDGGDEPLGFVMMRVGGGEAEVLTIVTRAHARRCGVAKALMKAATEKVRQLQATKIFLEVATDNVSAKALYLSLGFAVVGRRKAYYSRPGGSRVDALVMALEL